MSSLKEPHIYKRGEKEAESLERRRKKFMLLNKMLILLVGLAVITAIYLWRSGFFDDALGQANIFIKKELDSAGLTVSEIEISGNRFTLNHQINQAMGNIIGLPIMELDIYQVSENIKLLPFVKEVSLKRLMPNKITLEIYEHQPEFLWQIKGKIWLLSRDGIKITDKNIGRFAAMTHLVGKGVVEALDEVLILKKLNPIFFKRIKTLNRISLRRWDVTLKDGVKIMLPENRVSAQKKESLKRIWLKLIDFDNEKTLFKRNILILDLRLPDKVIIRLTPEAAEKRRKELKEKKTLEKTKKHKKTHI